MAWTLAEWSGWDPRRWSGAGGGAQWLRGWCGIAGPVLFTAAWVAGSLCQAGYSAGRVQLSGLAALDARDPQIMIAGFVALGVCSVAFGAGLGSVAAAGKAGPGLVMAAGAAAIAAGAFRRDHLLLTGPGFAGESWHNQVHDVVSALAYAAMIAAPLVFARRFRGDPDWDSLRRPLQALALVSAVALALFASRAAGPWNPVVQRAAVTLALAAEVLLAARMLTLGPAQADTARVPLAASREGGVHSRTVQVTAGLVARDAWAPFGQLPTDESDPTDNTVLSFAWADPHVNYIGHTFDEIEHTENGALCTLLNRHDTATQTLMPMNMDALMVVAPAHLDFSSDEDARLIQAFVVRQYQCINLAVGTWHWGPYPTAMGSLRLFNIQGRRYVEDNRVVYLERDLGILVEAVIPRLA